MSRQPDGYRRDRHCWAAPGRFPANPLAGFKSTTEEPVGDRARHSLAQGELVGALHLSLDLRLTDRHRLEPGRHTKKVPHRVAAAQRVAPEQLRRADVRLTGQRSPRELGRRGEVGRYEVQLRAVAGREG